MCNALLQVFEHDYNKYICHVCCLCVCVRVCVNICVVQHN